MNPCRRNPCWWCDTDTPHPRPGRIDDRPREYGPHEAAQLGDEWDKSGSGGMYDEGWTRRDPITDPARKGSVR